MNRHLTFALLALPLGLMLFVIAIRASGQPSPLVLPTGSVSNEPPQPEYTRTITWTRDTNVTTYTLTVNSSIFMQSASVVSNAPLRSGTNTLSLYGINSVGQSPTVRTNYLILPHQDVGWFIEGSTNLLGTYTRTNPPAMERDRKGPNFFFRIKTWTTNSVEERHV